MLGRGQYLPLIDQIHITPQGRGRPGILRYAYGFVRQRMGGHAYASSLLRAVDAGHAMLGQQAAPKVVGQYHVIGNQAVQGRVAAPGDQAYGWDRKSTRLNSSH